MKKEKRIPKQYLVKNGKKIPSRYQPKKAKNIPREYQHGLRVQNTIRDDLKKLLAKNKILRYRKGTQKEDHEGIDFVVTSLQGVVVPLQVKSDPKDQEQHAERYPLIPSIGLGRSWPDQREEQIVQIITEYSEGKILHLPYHKKASPPQ